MRPDSDHLGQAADVQRARIGLPSGTEGSEDPQAGLDAPADERGLGREIVDAVHDECRTPGQQAIRCRLVKQGNARLNLSMRRDPEQVRPQCRHLWRTHVRSYGARVAIERGEGHLIEVDEPQTPNAAAYQQLRSVAADAANTDDDDEIIRSQGSRLAGGGGATVASRR